LKNNGHAIHFVTMITKHQSLIYMYALTWNHALSGKAKCPTYKPLLLKNPCCWLQYYYTTCNQQKWSKAVHVC